MMRLMVEGPEEKVRAFLKDFAVLPQHEVKATSTPYDGDDLMNDEIRVVCHFEHHLLSEINQPITVMFQTMDGKHLSFTMLRGSVFRSGNTVSISGQAVK